ncbi:MAG: dual specificity protein phosphatase family protein [Pseudomonadota bacterium]
MKPTDPPMPPYLITEAKNSALWMMPAPTFAGGVPATLDRCCELRIQHIVSLVEDNETWLLGLEKLGYECFTRNIELLKMPIVDRKTPASIEEFTALLSVCHHLMREGESIGVHFKSGIGRSGLLICSLLGRLGFDMQEALNRIRDLRGLEAPNTVEQLDWLKEKWPLLSRPNAIE